jgi:hypothetical protein
MHVGDSRVTAHLVSAHKKNCAKLLSAKPLAQSDFHRDFHKPDERANELRSESLCADTRQSAPNGGFIAIRETASAPIARHPPVDGLHLIARKGFKVVSLLLTIEIEGVKTYSFFDTF